MRLFKDWLYFSQAAQNHHFDSYFCCFNLNANVQRVKRDMLTDDIYYYTTTEFDYAKRESRLTAYRGVVLQEFEITKVCLGKNSNRYYNRNFFVFSKKLLGSMPCLFYPVFASQLDPKPIKRVIAFRVSSPSHSILLHTRFSYTLDSGLPPLKAKKTITENMPAAPITPQNLSIELSTSFQLNSKPSLSLQRTLQSCKSKKAGHVG